MSEPLEIVKYPAPVLKKRGEPVTVFDESFRETVERMKQTMLKNDGIGLAAPQVAISKRFFIMGVPVDSKNREGERDWYVITNPEFLSKSDETIAMEEGCLSFPGLFFEVIRPETVTIRYQDEFGKSHELTANSYLARVIQHEYDHLDGILYIERISALKRSLLKNKLKRLTVEGTLD